MIKRTLRLLSRRMSTSSQSPPPPNSTYLHKGVLYDKASKKMISCLFCRIHDRTEAGTIEYEDDKHVVFRTIAPITSFHVLVTPRAHIKNLRHVPRDLEGAKLLYKLKQIGIKTILQKYAGDQRIAETAQYCFHVPPYNSIDHLHLHAIAHPETIGFVNAMKYPSSNSFYCNHVDSLIQQSSPEFYKKLVEKGKLFDCEYDPEL